MPLVKNKNISDTYYLIEENTSLQFLTITRRNTTMEYLDNWYEHQTKFMNEFGTSEEQFEEALKERVITTINDTPIVVWDDAVFSILQISSEFAMGAAYHSGFKVILMNTKTWEMKAELRDAIIWHELGHKSLGHESIEQHQELEADQFSLTNGHDMHGVLVHIRAELIRMFAAMGLPQQNIDAAMPSIDERIAAVA